MKKQVLFSILILLSGYVQGQEFFNNRYIIDQTAIVFRRLVQTGDTIITMGLGSTFYFPYPSKLMFTKFNPEGEVLDYDLIIGDSLTHYYPLSSSPYERKLIIVGGAGENSTNESGFYALYDLDNGLEWIKQYHPPDGWTLFFESCLFLEDKILILANQQDHNNGSIISAKLICTDFQGDILWEKNFADDNFNIKPGSIILNQNSNIYIGLGKYNFPFTLDNDARSLIYELDLEGNIMNDWINDEINTYRPEQIIEVGDSSLLFVGRYLAGHNANDLPLFQGYICKVDSLNSVDWSLKTGTMTYQTDMNNLIATMDGNYIAIGVTLDSLSSSGVLTESGHIVKFNIEGEILWESRFYGVDSGAEHNVLNDIVQLPDSSLLLCGLSTDSWADFPQRGWLLKLGKKGIIDSTVSIFYPNQDVFEKANIVVSPNPAREQIEIKINENININMVEIFDASGKLVISRNYNTTNNHIVPLNISQLSAGVYIVQVNRKYLKKVVVF